MEDNEKEVLAEEIKKLHEASDNIVDRAANAAVLLLKDDIAEAVSVSFEDYHRRSTPKFVGFVAIVAVIAALLVAIPVALVVTGQASNTLRSANTNTCRQLKGSQQVQLRTQQQIRGNNEALAAAIKKNGKSEAKVFGLTEAQLKEALARSDAVQQLQIDAVTKLLKTSCT